MSSVAALSRRAPALPPSRGKAKALSSSRASSQVKSETQPATTTTIVNPLADSFPVEVKCLEVELLGAEAVLIRPEAGGEYEEWLACLRSVGMKGAAMAKMRK